MASVFEYKAKNRQGKSINGTFKATDSSEVVKQLREQGYMITSMKKKLESGDLSNYLKVKKKVKTRDLAIFSQQFAVMINAGVNLIDSFELLQGQVEHSHLSEVIVNIKEDIETGSNLSEAMKKHPDVFPDLYCQMVKTGETGGVLDKVLMEMANHYERQEEINAKIKSGLYYPITILIVAVMVVIFLMTKVVPQFINIFKRLEAELPLPTKILLLFSNIISNYWWIIFIVLGIFLMGFFSFSKSPRGKEKIDNVSLKIPLFGGMLKKLFISRIASTLSILLESGVDLLSALAIVEDVVGNKIYANILRDARIQVRKGITFNQPLSRSKVIPDMVVHMVKIGEETGSLENMLKKVALFYDREVETSVNGTISVLEPALLVFLAVIVGFIVVSIVIPMFDMFQYF